MPRRGAECEGDATTPRGPAEQRMTRRFTGLLHQPLGSDEILARWAGSKVFSFVVTSRRRRGAPRSRGVHSSRRARVPGSASSLRRDGEESQGKTPPRCVRRASASPGRSVGRAGCDRRHFSPPPTYSIRPFLLPPPPPSRGSRSQTSSTTSRRSRATAAARRSSSSSSTASMTSSAARGRAWTCARRPGAGSRWRRSTCR